MRLPGERFTGRDPRRNSMGPDLLFETSTELFGDAGTVLLAGLIVGLVFGIAAQRSRFCLRAGIVEFAGGRLGPRFAVWLLCFSTGLAWTQGLDLRGVINLDQTRWLAQIGTISGAVIGGLIFGIGMILSRGCPGRLLVLGATGNLRAILSGLVFAVAAQISLYGLAAPLRSGIAQVAVTNGPPSRLDVVTGFPESTGFILGMLLAGFSLWLAWRNRISISTLVFGCGVGFAAALGWYLTFSLNAWTFEPTSIKSLTFSGPSADMLMFVLLPDGVLDFDIGLIPGVFAGAFLAALFSGDLEWQGWSEASSMHRYLIGAMLMGFGAMLAGGCSIGAGVTGGSTMAFTAWLALTAMWVGGSVTHWLVDQHDFFRKKDEEKVVADIR
jgi:uncharacterized protein